MHIYPSCVGETTRMLKSYEPRECRNFWELGFTPTCMFTLQQKNTSIAYRMVHEGKNRLSHVTGEKHSLHEIHIEIPGNSTCLYILLIPPYTSINPCLNTKFEYRSPIGRMHVILWKSNMKQDRRPSNHILCVIQFSQ